MEFGRASWWVWKSSPRAWPAFFRKISAPLSCQWRDGYSHSVETQGCPEWSDSESSLSPLCFAALGLPSSSHTWVKVQHGRKNRFRERLKEGLCIECSLGARPSGQEVRLIGKNRIEGGRRSYDRRDGSSESSWRATVNSKMLSTKEWQDQTDT